MSPLKLHSPLAKPIQHFITLRRLSGTDYRSQAHLLGYFDRFLLEQRLRTPRITREITDGYQQSLSHLAPRTERRLYIAEGKFRKARWAPLSISTCRALERYVRTRVQIRPRSPDSPLPINQRSRRLNQCTVNQTFRHVLRQCGIVHRNHTGPRIHDLRHYAVHRLLAWYRDGGDVNARLPYLATYMGHVDVHSTHIYLQSTAELVEQVNRRFHTHYLHQVKNNGGKT
jgi:integrase